MQPGPTGHRACRLPDGPCAARSRWPWPSRCCSLRSSVPCAWPATSATREAGRSAEQVTIIKSGRRLPDRVRDRDGGRPVRQRRRPGRPRSTRSATSPARPRRSTETRDNAELDELQTAHVNAPARPQPGHARRRGRDARPRHLDRPGAPARVQRLPPHHQRERRTSTPEPRLEQLSPGDERPPVPGDAAGPRRRHRRSPQSGSQELFSEIGVEASAIDRLAGSVEGAEDLDRPAAHGKPRHASQIRDDSATDLGGRDAYLPYDEITETLIDGVDDLARPRPPPPPSATALFGAVLTLLALAAAIALAIFIARSLLEPDRQGPRRRTRGGPSPPARRRRPDPRRRGAGADQADRRHDQRGDRPGRPRGRRPPPPGHPPRLR